MQDSPTAPAQPLARVAALACRAGGRMRRDSTTGDPGPVALHKAGGRGRDRVAPGVSTEVEVDVQPQRQPLPRPTAHGDPAPHLLARHRVGDRDVRAADPGAGPQHVGIREVALSQPGGTPEGQRRAATGRRRGDHTGGGGHRAGRLAQIRVDDLRAAGGPRKAQVDQIAIGVGRREQPAAADHCDPQERRRPPRQRRRSARIGAGSTGYQQAPGDRAEQKGEGANPAHLLKLTFCGAELLRELGPGEVAQLVEHTTENRGVGGSIPPLATA